MTVSVGREQLDALRSELEAIDPLKVRKADYEAKASALADEWVSNRIMANWTEKGFRFRLIAELEAAWREVQFWPSEARREGEHEKADILRAAALRLMTWMHRVGRFQYAGSPTFGKRGLYRGGAR